MVNFNFIARHSFLNYKWHPITVPGSQVDYELLEAEKLYVEDLTVICPNGEKMSGYMYYYGVAKRKPYYQIKVRGHQIDHLGRLPFGQRLIVEIERLGSEVQVRLNTK